MTARDDYPTLARIEARHAAGDETTTSTQELTFALDEIDRLRAIRDIVEHA